MNTDNSTHEYYIHIKESELLMNTHEVRVSLETAKMLQKAGFDWECEYAFAPTTEMGDKAYRYNQGKSHNYNNKEDYPFEIYSAPSLAVAQKWLREVKKLYIEIHRMPKCDLFDRYFTSINIMQEPFDTELRDKDEEIIYISEKTYEEALEAGIKKCLTILLEEKK